MARSRESAAWELEALKSLDLLFDAFRTELTDSQTAAYLAALEGCAIEAVRDACRAFATGTVSDFNPNYGPPTAPRVAMLARLLEPIKAEAGEIVVYPIGELPPPGFTPLGPTSIDFGHGRIDLRGLSHAEKEAILQNKGRVPDLIEGSRKAPLPSLKRMNG